PLRLARYGVPISQTGAAGLAAAGIKPPVIAPAASKPDLVTDAVEPREHNQLEAAFDGPALASSAAESPAALDAGPSRHPSAEEDVPGRQHPEEQALEPDEAALIEAVYAQAVRDFVVSHGDYPNARQFALWLHDRYGVRTAEGGLLSEAELRPYLREMRHREGESLVEESLGVGEWPEAVVASEEVGQLQASVMSDVADPWGGVADPTTPMSDPVQEPVPSYAEPVSSAMADIADGRFAESLDRPSEVTTTAPVAQTSVMADGAVGESRWDAAVTDSGAATARVPEQQAQEPELDAEQQRIQQVADWLAEAEDRVGLLHDRVTAGFMKSGLRVGS
ncbi:hypothetical protein ACH429_25845, partial [Streptomyces pathocidini]